MTTSIMNVINIHINTGTAMDLLFLNLGLIVQWWWWWWESQCTSEWQLYNSTKQTLLIYAWIVAFFAIDVDEWINANHTHTYDHHVRYKSTIISSCSSIALYERPSWHFSLSNNKNRKMAKNRFNDFRILHSHQIKWLMID